MGLEEIIPSIGLILVLILILPGFIKSNLKKKVFLATKFRCPFCNHDGSVECKM